MLKLFLSFNSIERHKAPPLLPMDTDDLADSENILFGTNLVGAKGIGEILNEFALSLLTSKG